METKQQALKIAKRNLQTRGFNGFSFQDIADTLGIRKASLHYYFKSKEELGLALIEDYQLAYQQWAQSVQTLSAQKKIEKMIQLFCSMSEDNLKICPTGVLCSDLNTLPTKMKKQLLELHQTQRDWLIETLKQGVQEKSLRQDLDIKATADLVWSTIQGGLQLARLRGQSKLLKDLGASLLKLMTT